MNDIHLAFDAKQVFATLIGHSQAVLQKVGGGCCHLVLLHLVRD